MIFNKMHKEEDSVWQFTIVYTLRRNEMNAWDKNNLI